MGCSRVIVCYSWLNNEEIWRTLHLNKIHGYLQRHCNLLFTNIPVTAGNLWKCLQLLNGWRIHSGNELFAICHSLVSFLEAYLTYKFQSPSPRTKIMPYDYSHIMSDWEPKWAICEQIAFWKLFICTNWQRFINMTWIVHVWSKSVLFPDAFLLLSKNLIFD